MSDPTAQPGLIANFLEMARPDRQFVIGAIPVEGGAPRVQTFDDARAAAEWAATMNANKAHNLYWTHNRLRDPMNRKPREEDVAEALFAHVDIDPRAPAKDATDDAKALWNDTERDRILAQLTAFVPSPTFIVDSGGGFQGFWRLADPFFIGGAIESIANFKAYNIGLRDSFLGADSCQSLDHLMRLPGTVNWPDEKKRRKGRRARLASVVDRDGRVSDLSDLMPAAIAPTRAAGTVPAAQRGDVRRLAHPDDLLDWGIGEADRLRVLIVQGCDPDKFDGDRSKVVFDLCCHLHRRGVPPGLIAGIISDPAWPISEHVIDKGKGDVPGYAWRQVEQAIAKVAEDNESGGRRVLDPAAPFATASRLRAELFPDAIHTNDDWLEYDRGAYRAVEDATMRSALWSALDAAVVRTVTKGVVTFEPLKPGPGQISGVLDALKGVAHQPADRMAPPVWLDGDGPPPGEIVALRNGLLHVPSGELLPPTPRFFTRNALDLDFHPGAPKPVAWHGFVESVFPDADAAALLQEWFGYFLLPDTSQEKMLLLVGPPRSGKGTIQKVLTELVGRANVCAPSIKSLGGNFGLQPMIGKQVAFLSDIRIGSGSDRAAITETLLRITGRDDVTADRKNKEAWTGRLAVRFFIATNEMPSLSDNSPALAHRFVPLILERSFLGKEDPGLADRLVSELPGILNWALAGWRRLRERGHFVLPDASTAAIGEIMELGSPVAAFIRDMCEVAAGRRVEKERLYAAWQRWCEANKLVPGRIEHFARNLRAATSHQVDSARPSIDGQRTYVFEGIALSGDDVPY